MRHPVLITAMVAMAAAAAVPLVMNSTSNVTGYVPEAYAFWLTSDTSRFRMNVRFNTVDLPQEVLDSSVAYRNYIGAHDDGTYDIAVWHGRAGRWQKVGVIRAPLERNRSFYHRVGSLWQNGDIVAYQYNPAMQAGECETVYARGSGRPVQRCKLPFASLVDNVSNDPVTAMSTKIDFEYEIEVH